MRWRALLSTFALVLALTGATACTVPTPSLPVASGGLGNGWEPSGHLDLQYATQFAVDHYQDRLELITIHEGSGASRFLVVPEGGTAPAGIAADITVLHQPLTNLYVAATATMSLFVALDSLTSVRYSSVKADSWYVPEAKAAMESGQIVYGGKYSSPDYEFILQNRPSLALESTMINHVPEVKEKLQNIGIPVLVEQSSYESHPLGRTEWIKLFGVLLGKEDLADQIFASQAAQLDALAGRPDTGKTIAFFSISSAGYAVARKSGDYIVQMIKLAGGEYVFKNLGDDTATSTINLEMEQFYAQAKDADYIIYNATIGGELNSLAELTGLSPLLGDFKAVQTGQVWCTGKDFYQDMTGLGTMITDIHTMLTATDATPDQLNFLHRLR